RRPGGPARLVAGGCWPDVVRSALRGGPAGLCCVADYVRGTCAVAACRIGRNPAFPAFLHLLGPGRGPGPDQI
ncbi:hypothetical protein CCS92_34655, partial [Methylobacterium radiotolerans]